jgi:Tol biopolymer transport system component
MTVAHAEDLPETGQQDFGRFTGPYLGQEPPGLVPELFAPGIISTADSEGCAVFSEDGRSLVFTRFSGEPLQRYNFVMQEDHGQWTEPRALPFATEYPIADFTYSPDGKHLLFTSRRPITGQGKRNEKRGLWSVKITAASWGEPVPFDDVINRRDALYPSMTRDGSLYFMDWYYPPDDERSTDIYVSRLVDGEYTEPERVSDKINSEFHDFDPFVAPDESYMIFCSIRPGDLGNGDLYISFREENGTWSEAVNMGSKFNSAAGENRPFVTLDGRYFFFTSNKEANLEPGDLADLDNLPGNGSRDVYWVDAAALEQFRPDPD